MYAYLQGKLAEINDQSVILDIHGIGYLINLPHAHFKRLPPINSDVKLHISFIIRENSQSLYGFLTKEEKELFELLISISGIGPKTAMSLISHLDFTLLQEAILTGNAKKLSEVPGIGKKTAERLILELKGKLPSLPQIAHGSSKEREAQAALMNLGYSQKMAELAIAKALINLPEGSDISLLIREAIKQGYKS